MTSSWPNAALSVYDADANNANNGRLINGASIIPRDMEVMNSTARVPDDRSATARDDGDLDAPVASAPTTITYPSGRSEQRRARSRVGYAKTLTFSLSTTTP